MQFSCHNLRGRFSVRRGMALMQLICHNLRGRFSVRRGMALMQLICHNLRGRFHVRRGMALMQLICHNLRGRFSVRRGMALMQLICHFFYFLVHVCLAYHWLDLMFNNLHLSVPGGVELHVKHASRNETGNEQETTLH